jgi:hypothetical protein
MFREKKVVLFHADKRDENSTKDNFNCCLSAHVDNYTIIVPKNVLVFIKSTRYYNLYFLSLYS